MSHTTNCLAAPPGAIPIYVCVSAFPFASLHQPQSHSSFGPNLKVKGDLKREAGPEVAGRHNLELIRSHLGSAQRELAQLARESGGPNTLKGAR